MGMKPTCDCGSCRLCTNREHNRAYRKANPEKERARQLRKRGKYLRTWRAARLKSLREAGIDDPERALEALTAGHLSCEICGRDLELSTKDTHWSRQAATDHDHSTRKFRGILCHGCNRGIGLFKDCPDWLESAADYVRSRRQ